MRHLDIDGWLQRLVIRLISEVYCCIDGTLPENEMFGSSMLEILVGGSCSIFNC